MKLNFNSIPRDYWNWRCTGLLLVVALSSIVSLTWLSDDQHNRLGVAASLDGLVRGPAAVAATLCFFMAWRVSAKPQLIWLASACAATAAQSVVMSRLQVSDVSRQFEGSPWLYPFDLLGLLLVARLSIAAARRTYVGRPLLLGLLAGLTLGLGRVVAVLYLPDVRLGVLAWLPLVVVFGGVALYVVRLLSLVPDVPRWASSRLGVAVVLYCVGHLALLVDGGRGSAAASVVALGADLSGAIILAAGAVAVLVMVMVENGRDLDRLQVRLDELEAGRRSDRARIHEINATVAGVVSASQLLREASTLESERRRQIDNMVRAELSRLQRLLNEPAADERREPPGSLLEACDAVVDLDETICTLIVAQEARGNRVSWLPSGAQVTAAPDAVAEVLNILLDNAAKHGSRDTSVTVTPVADAVEVVVSDDGPGIAPEVRSHLFEWGARGPRSGGQGIGLHIAHDLTARHGGYLTVRDTTARGATFVAAFPRARRGDDEPAHIA